MSNLTQRVLTAVVGVPLLYFVFYLGGIPFLIFILAVIFLGELEFFKLLEAKGVSSERESGVILGLICFNTEEVTSSYPKKTSM